MDDRWSVLSACPTSLHVLDNGLSTAADLLPPFHVIASLSTVFIKHGYSYPSIIGISALNGLENLDKKWNDW